MYRTILSFCNLGQKLDLLKVKRESVHMYMYALNFDNMYLWRTCKRLGPVRVRRSKYLLLLCRGQSCHSVTGLEMIDFFRLKWCLLDACRGRSCQRVF